MPSSSANARFEKLTQETKPSRWEKISLFFPHLPGGARPARRCGRVLPGPGDFQPVCDRREEPGEKMTRRVVRVEWMEVDVFSSLYN